MYSGTITILSFFYLHKSVNFIVNLVFFYPKKNMYSVEMFWGFTQKPSYI